MGTFTRGIATHMRGILICSSAIGLLAAAPSLLLPTTYVAQSTVRVVPPEEQDYIDAAALDTAVAWYIALADVPAVVQKAAFGVQPPMSPEDVRKQTTLTFGPGPGEVAVRGFARDPVEAVALSDAMAEAVVSTVDVDKSLQIGATSLSPLVPAQPAKRAGTGPATLFVTGFLLGFVLLATGAALLDRRMNWRLSPRILRSLGEETGVPVITDGDELAALLTLKGREGPQAWLSTMEGVPQTWWRDLQENMQSLGGASEVVSISPTRPADRDPAPGLVYLPDPNDGSAATLGAVAATGVPVLLVCPDGQRSRGLRRLLAQLPEFAVRPLALTIGKEQD